MAKFYYKYRDGSQTKTGEVSADSLAHARNKLGNRGIKPYKISAVVGDNVRTSGGLGKYIYKDKEGKVQISLFEGGPSDKDIAVFTKQFALMIQNGVPILQSLKLLVGQQKTPIFQGVVNDIAGAIEKGSTLASAIAQHPKIFDKLYLAMVKAGEASGSLDVTLTQLVVYLEKSIKVKNQVKSATRYPAVIVFVAVAVIVLLLSFVVPKFAETFAQNGQELPGLTLLVLDLSNGIQEYWYLLVGAIILMGVALKLYRNTKHGEIVLDRMILSAPLIGDVLKKIAIGRFCSTMSTMLKSGVSILEALQICASSSGNRVIEDFVLGVRAEISEGNSFAEPLKAASLFPLMVASMVEVGESTGALDETLAKVTEIYDDEVDLSIEAMTSMIEPILIVVIGSIVGFIVLAMYLPIFEMASAVGG